jgi:hypothetical protein
MSQIITDIMQKILSAGLNDLRKSYLVWVSMGALVGGISSATLKIQEIGSEPKVEYKNKTLETPIRFTYHASRVAGHAGFGSAVGGITAATAPVSIPLYVWWRSDFDKK